ncbi:MAG: polymer-forming cytoskeletal protein [Prevotella sp.]|jgi:cytoskeletal protein CcmA (bactofilin family)|nr:polymer-forming cytoskeletal protein [Prevotella sp.]
MFNQNKGKSYSKPETTSKALSILSASITIVGKIQAEDDLRIDGNVIGDIVSTGKVVVGPEGCVRGNIKSKSVDLSGKIYGDVTVSEIITMKESSYYKGEVRAHNIEIEAGASFYGNCMMEEEIEENKIIGLNKIEEREQVISVSKLVEK